MKPLQALAFMLLLFTIPIAFGLALYIGDLRLRASYYVPPEPTIYVVREGDNVWTIAANHYGDDVDTRFAVHAIIEANNLRSGGLIWPNQKLILPELGR